jgi:hypothetical protein
MIEEFLQMTEERTAEQAAVIGVSSFHVGLILVLTGNKVPANSLHFICKLSIAAWKFSWNFKSADKLLVL